MIREDDTFSVTVRMAEIETLKEAISRNLMLRVFIGKRTATSHTSDISGVVVDRLVDETVEMARLTSEDERRPARAGFFSRPFSGPKSL